MHEHDPIYSLTIYTCFSGQFFLEKDCNGKKIVVTCLDVIMITFLLRDIQWSSLFAREARVNTERVPPEHTIILLKSNNYNISSMPYWSKGLLINKDQMF